MSRFLVASFIVLSLLITEISANACRSPCVTNYAECGISNDCAAACSDRTFSCINKNQAVCPPSNSPQVSCWIRMSSEPYCQCIPGLSACRYTTDEQLTQGGRCEISGGGIALAVIVPLVLIVAIATGVWCCYQRKARAQYEQLGPN